MANKHNTSKVDIPEMMRRLDAMYDKEEQLKNNIHNLQLEYKQLQEDKSMLQSMIMYHSNKLNRMRGLKKNGNRN